jgi:hypothetical protein
MVPRQIAWSSCARAAAFGRLRGITLPGLCAFIIALVAMPPSAQATTWTVEWHDPGQDLVGAAVRSAGAGDTVLVGPGTYYEHISVSQSVTIIGRDGPFQTILDGSRSWPGGQGKVLDCVDNLMNPVLRFEGMTIQHGIGSGQYCAGGGVRVATWGAAGSATFRECRLVENENLDPQGLGGAVFAVIPQITFEECYFSGNTVAYSGGLMYLMDSSVRFEGCEINLAEGAYQVEMINCSSFAMVQCTVQNGANGGGYFLSYGADRFDIEDNTFISRGANMACSISASGVIRFVRNRLWTDQAFPDFLVIFDGTSTVQDNAFIRVPTVVAGTLDLARNMFFEGRIEVYRSGAATCNVTWPNPLVVVEGPITLQDNVVADPLLCHASEPDFTVAETSPCTAAHSPPGCGVIGSAVVGCQITPIERATWGRIKAAFR